MKEYTSWITVSTAHTCSTVRRAAKDDGAAAPQSTKPGRRPQDLPRGDRLGDGPGRPKGSGRGTSGEEGAGEAQVHLRREERRGGPEISIAARLRRRGRGHRRRRDRGAGARRRAVRDARGSRCRGVCGERAQARARDLRRFRGPAQGAVRQARFYKHETAARGRDRP